MTNATTKTLEALNAAEAVRHAASKADTEATRAYRAREIGDVEFCNVRAAFKAASMAFDVAERAHLDALDVEPPTVEPVIEALSPQLNLFSK